MVDTADSKSKRYDRQIRIWGAEGQQRLESSRIALLNCSATGAETLKNLVLGGIASFTIVDGSKVTAADLGSNFLVDQSRLGQSRAQAVTDLLKEMNDTVSGSYVEDSPEQLLESRPEFLAGYDLVIATQVGPVVLHGGAAAGGGGGSAELWLMQRLHEDTGVVGTCQRSK
jgi:amyloid beta precursor protein binding protein 1